MSATRLAIALIAALAASGCARDIGGASVDSRQVGAAVRTDLGVVEAVRVVQVRDGAGAEDNLLGGAVGGVTGGVIGSTIGGGSGRTLAVLGGALAGAALGSVVQDQTGRQTANEYVVMLENGQRVTIIQSDSVPIAVGTPVFVQQGAGGQRARISPTR